MRNLRGVLATETGAALTGFLLLQEPDKAMREAEAEVGQYTHNSVTDDHVVPYE